jgi:acetyltransferase-like isoleucine patch superfamily enzyme
MVFKIEWSETNSIVDLGAASLKGRVFSKVPASSDNLLQIGKGAKVTGTIEFLGNGNKVIIGDDCHFRGDIIVKGNAQTVSFGDHSTTVGVYILCQENCDVTIGKWCMFSREIEVRTTDAHSVIDRSTGRRLNKDQSIIVGDHVWVGVGAIINKGAVVPSDSIVGAMSFVNSKFDEEGVVLAGSPAKIVKRGITWNRSRRDKFTPEQMDHWKD